MSEPVREGPAEPTPCCCVMVKPGEQELECYGYTSGPDDPFCKDCADRHVDEPFVVVGMITVTARMPRREVSVDE